MRSLDLWGARAAADARSSEDFAAANPGPALLVAVLDAGPRRAEPDGPKRSSAWTWTDSPAKLPAKVSLADLPASTRILWPDEKPAGELLELKIGRDATCEVAVPSARLSRHHATLRRLPVGAWMIVDVGSANGTALNGRIVSASRIASGDVLVLGEAVVIVPYFAPEDLHRALRG